MHTSTGACTLSAVRWNTGRTFRSTLLRLRRQRRTSIHQAFPGSIVSTKACHPTTIRAQDPMHGLLEAIHATPDNSPAQGGSIADRRLLEIISSQGRIPPANRIGGQQDVRSCDRTPACHATKTLSSCTMGSYEPVAVQYRTGTGSFCHLRNRGHLEIS